ncbi:MAG: VirB8/TrbF family protein [Ferrimonas sp.]
MAEDTKKNGENVENVDRHSAFYLRARQEWNEQIGTAVHQLKVWKVVAIASLGIATISTIGVVYIGSQSKIKPYVIAIDGDKMVPLMAAQNMPTNERQKVAIAELASFIGDMRSVYADQTAQNQAVHRAYAHLQSGSSAYAIVTNYLAVEAVPPKRAQTETVTVQIETILPTGEHSYQIDWRENIIDKRGQSREKRFRAIATVAFVGVPTAAAFQANPLGLVITDLAITERL